MKRELGQALDRLRDEQHTITPKVLRALSDLSRSELHALQATWGQISTKRRHALLAGLIAYAEEHIEVSYNPFLRWLLRDDDPVIRRMTITGLWEDNDEALVGLLVPILLSDPASDVRANAADALGRFVLLGELGEIPPETESRAVETLRASLDSPAEVMAVRRLAVEAIAYASDPDVRSIISRAYVDSDAAMRVSAVRAMGNTGDDYWWPQIQTELNNATPTMRAQAAYAAGELEATAALPQLVRLVDDPEEEVCVAAARALGYIGGSRARQALLKLAQSSDQLLREVAREALSELEFATVASLTELLDDSAIDADTEVVMAEDDGLTDEDDGLTDEGDELIDDELAWDDEDSWDSEDAWDSENWEAGADDEESFDDADDFDDDTAWHR